MSFVALSIRHVKLETPAMEDMGLRDVLATPVGEERVFAIGLFADCIEKRQVHQSVVPQILARLDQLSTKAILHLRIEREMIEHAAYSGRRTLRTSNNKSAGMTDISMQRTPEAVLTGFNCARSSSSSNLSALLASAFSFTVGSNSLSQSELMSNM